MTDTARDVEELALELEGPDLPQETYLDAVGRITSAWMTAREIMTAEIPPPRSDEAEGRDEPSQAETEWVREPGGAGGAAAPRPGTPPGGGRGAGGAGSVVGMGRDTGNIRSRAG